MDSFGKFHIGMMKLKKFNENQELNIDKFCKKCFLNEEWNFRTLSKIITINQVHE